MLIGSDNRDVAFSSKVFYFLSDYVFNLCMNIPKDYVSDWCFCFVVFPPMCSPHDPVSPLFDCVHLVQVCLVYYPCLVLYIKCCLFLVSLVVILCLLPTLCSLLFWLIKDCEDETTLSLCSSLPNCSTVTEHQTPNDD